MPVPARFRVAESQAEDLVSRFVPDLDPMMKAEPSLRQLVAHHRARSRQRGPPRGLGVGKLDPLVVTDDGVVEDIEEVSGHFMPIESPGAAGAITCVWSSR